MNWWGTQTGIFKIGIIIALLGGGIGLVFVVQNSREDKNPATDTKENTENRIVKPPKGIGTQEEETDNNNGIEDIALAVPNLEIGGESIAPIVKKKPILKKPKIVPINLPSKTILSTPVIPNTPTIPNTPVIPPITITSQFPIQAGGEGIVNIDSNIALFPDGSKLIGGYYTGQVTLAGGIILPGGNNTYIAKINTAGEYVWSKTYYSDVSFDSNTLNITVQTDGSSIIQSFFFERVIFGNTVLTAADANIDGYIVKIDNNGNFAWVKQLGGTGAQYIDTIRIQGDGSIFVTGQFENTVILGNTTLTSADTDGFIAKLDNNGNFAWVKQVEGIGDQYIRDIQVLADGNSIISIDFSSQAIIDGTTLTTPDAQDAYIIKIDVDGNIIWSTQVGGSGGQIIDTVKVQTNGNIIVTGQFDNTVILGATTLTSADTDGFITQLDGNGDFIWAMQINGIYYTNISEVQILADGSSIITGRFDGSVTIDGNILNAIDGGIDSYIAKIDSDGNSLWVQQVGGVGEQIIRDIGLQADGSSLIIGRFGIDQEVILGATTFTSTDYEDSYIAKLDDTGNFVWAKQITGENGQSVIGLDIHSDNTITLIGNFVSEMIFDNTNILINNTGQDIGFVLVLNTDATLNKAQSTDLGLGGTIDLGQTKILADGSSIITGRFLGIVNFGNIVLNTDRNRAYDYDTYIAKIDANGNYLWAQSIGDFNTPEGSSENVTVQSDGSSIISGKFNNQALIGDTTLIATNTDSYITKIDSNGEFVWASQIGGISAQYIEDIQIQVDGSSIITGNFNNQAILGTTTLTAIDQDIYIAKIDVDGEFVWVQQVAGNGNQYIYNIKVQTDGTSIVIGGFDDQAILGSTTLTAIDSQDSYIAKIDNDGNYIWASQVGGINNQSINTIQVQADGSSIITGSFYNQVILGATTLTAVDGQGDSYIAKIDGDGNFFWATQIGGAGNQYIDDIQIDNDGNSIVRGYFNNQAILGPTTLTAIDEDSYISKIDNEGNFSWVRQVGGAGYQYIEDIQIDSDGSTIARGSFYEGPAIIGDNILNPADLIFEDSFIVKLDNNGNIVWIKHIAGLGGQLIDNIQVQADGSTIFTGSFGNNAILGDITLTKLGNNLAVLKTTDNGGFVGKINNNGDYLWVEQIGSTGNQSIEDIQVQVDGSSIVSGDFSGNLFLTQSGISLDNAQTLISNSPSAIYIAKLNPNGVWE